jgi:hypothetical protein
VIFNLVLSLNNKSSEFIFKVKEILISIPVINENTEERIGKLFILIKKGTQLRPFFMSSINIII